MSFQQVAAGIEVAPDKAMRRGTVPSTVLSQIVRAGLGQRDAPLEPFGIREQGDQRCPTSLGRRTLFEELARHTKNPDIGLAMAKNAPDAVLAPFLNLLGAQPDMRSVLLLAPSIYAVAYTRVRCSLTVEDLNAVVEIRLHGRHPRAAWDFWAAITHRIATALVPGWPPIRFEHSLPDTGSSSQYQAVFDCKMSFDHPRCRLIYPIQMLDVPIESHQYPGTEGDPIDFGREQCRTSSDLLNALEETYFDAVAAGASTVSDMAAFASVPTRQLRASQRMLGTSHRDLLDGARRKSVFRLLEDCSVDEVAHQAGFSDRAALNRAFRRWTGMTPASYRRQYTRELATMQQFL